MMYYLVDECVLEGRRVNVPVHVAAVSDIAESVDWAEVGHCDSDVEDVW